MHRYHAYILETLRLIESYSCEEPFSAYLKKQLSLDKRKGSRDRKYISDLCYRFLRIGFAFSELPKEERLWIALLLTANPPDELINRLKPEWSELCQHTVKQKLRYLGISAEPFNIFPFQEYLSDQLDRSDFQLRFLQQPQVFLRIRSGNESSVFSTLDRQNISYSQITPDCLMLNQGIDVDKLLQINKEVVIQDINSQKVVPLLYKVFSKSDVFSVWDCCAASGGKAIHMHDLFPASELFVSDLRPSILRNLRERFRQAGIHHYRAEVMDLSTSVYSHSKVDVILADVPCSGSGTWTRTPEQIRCFSVQKIKEFVVLQQKILTNAMAALKPGGYLLYSTCSVFQEENEFQVKWLQEKFHFRVLHSNLLKELEIPSDILFAALLQKN